MSERLIGLVMIIGSGIYLIIAMAAVNGYLADSEKVQGRVTAVSSGVGAPYATVEYKLADDTRHQTQFKMSSKSGSKKYRVGESVALYHNREDGSTRQAFFLSLWFRPLLAFIGVVLGGIFVYRATLGRGS